MDSGWTHRPWVVLAVAVAIGIGLEVLYAATNVPGWEPVWYLLYLLLPSGERTPQTPAYDYVEFIVQAFMNAVVVYALIAGLILSFRALRRKGP